MNCRPGVVRADHDHGQLGMQALEVAVIEPPQDVLGLIAADAEIQSMPFLVVFLPNFFAAPFPTMRDRIANEEQLGVRMLLHAFIQRVLPLDPAFICPGNGLRGRLRTSLSLQGDSGGQIRGSSQAACQNGDATATHTSDGSEFARWDLLVGLSKGQFGTLETRR